MAKKISDAVYDAALNHIKNNVTSMILLDAEPSSRAVAIANALATITVGAADVTVANGDVSGRKATVAGKTGESVTNSGTYNHTCLISATDLLVVSTATASKSLNSGDTVDVVSWDLELADPA